MKTLRRWLAALRPQREAEPVAPGFSYRIYWTKTTWDWPAEKRTRVLGLIREVMASPAFERNPFRRRYALEELGKGEYSGESLASLEAVLAAYGETEPGEG